MFPTKFEIGLVVREKSRLKGKVETGRTTDAVLYTISSHGLRPGELKWNKTQQLIQQMTNGNKRTSNVDRTNYNTRSNIISCDTRISVSIKIF